MIHICVVKIQSFLGRDREYYFIYTGSFKVGYTKRSKSIRNPELNHLILTVGIHILRPGASFTNMD